MCLVIFIVAKIMSSKKPIIRISSAVIERKNTIDHYKNILLNEDGNTLGIGCFSISKFIDFLCFYSIDPAYIHFFIYVTNRYANQILFDDSFD